MSLAVEIANLRDRVAEYGPVAFLITVGADRRPHVVSAGVELADGMLSLGAGRTTSSNVEATPTATVLWPALDGGDYCLIVDGAASIRDDGSGPRVAVDPVRAVLHRVAGAPESQPSCVTVLDQRAPSAPDAGD